MNTFIKAPSTYPHKKTVTSYTLDGTGSRSRYININPTFPHSAGDAMYHKDPYSTYGGNARLYNLSGRKFFASSPKSRRTNPTLPPPNICSTTPLPHSAYKKSLTLYLISAAKQSIPVFWRQTNPPTISYWFLCIERIAEMEALIHQSKENPTKFQKIWVCWLHFKVTANYRNSIKKYTSIPPGVPHNIPRISTCLC